MQTLEDPFYYLANFEHVLEWLRARYPDLLSSDELAFIDEFLQVPRSSRALLVRMVMRKGTRFRVGKLNYPEIGPASKAVKPLVEKGWVAADPVLELAQLFSLFTKPELVKAFAGIVDRPNAAKSELFQQVGEQDAGPYRLSQWWPDAGDTVFELTIMEMSERFRLMFFGNLRQTWSEFVLADLGLYRFETVEFSPASRAFQCRGEVDEYLHLYQCREQLEAFRGQAENEPDALEQVLERIPTEASENAWLEARRARLLYQAAYHCERCGELERALELYGLCSHAEARVRRIRVLERLGDLEAALSLAREARLSPCDAAESQHIARILPRLHRKLGLPGLPRHVQAPVERVDLVLPRPVTPMDAATSVGVELAVLEYLNQSESPVWYVENTLINALFGLLCWDIIFAPVPGAFFHRFHSGPADLLRPDFVPRRAGRFEQQLALLDTGAYKNAIREKYAAKFGLQSPFVHWHGLTETLLEQALACLPAAHLRAWFERLLEDIKANRAGMPDLIRFWPAERRYQMIEVKGPGDRLQDNQLRWLAFCAEHDMPVQVCYVQWEEEAGANASPYEEPGQRSSPLKRRLPDGQTP